MASILTKKPEFKSDISKMRFIAKLAWPAVLLSTVIASDKAPIATANVPKVIKKRATALGSDERPIIG
jgi:hypothetical protein